METLKNMIIGILFGIIIILSLYKGCNKEVIEVQGETKVVIDTVIIPTPYKVVVFEPKYYPKWDTIKLIKDTSKWNKDLCKFERSYADSTSDSNITIFSNIKTIGALKSNQLSYRLKVPQKIIITKDSSYIRTIQPKNTFTIIGGIGGNNNQFNINIGAALTNKNTYYGYTYDIVNKTHNINIGLMLFKSKK